VPERDAGIRVEVDRERCMGSGLCSTYAPGTFSQDGQAKVVLADPVGDPVEAIETAAEACPMSAIRVDTD
jgi:ferredoxin